ncbi:MAG: MerR family transcriptional regulator [bacterium]|nr:MerR family transcriptional regulator [bacterium]
MKLVGISYRQVQYWDKSNFLKPSYVRLGKYRQYTRSDLLVMKVVAVLREKNFSIQALRETIFALSEMLSRMSIPLDKMTILIDKKSILIFDGPVLTAGRHEYVQICATDLWHNVAELFE